MESGLGPGVILSVSEESGGMGGTQQEAGVFSESLLRTAPPPRSFAHAQDDVSACWFIADFFTASQDDVRRGVTSDFSQALSMTLRG
jgi:hypothetical protein